MDAEDIDSPIYDVVDDDRAWFVWDGDQIIGMCANFTLNTSTPGGDLPTAGVTFIAVRPTHRRRGVLRQMMDVLHADGIARNEPIATLWAADAAIYGRFGYGMATQLMSLTVPHLHGTLLDAPEDPSIRLRMVDTASDYQYVKPVYGVRASISRGRARADPGGLQRAGGLRPTALPKWGHSGDDGDRRG